MAIDPRRVRGAYQETPRTEVQVGTERLFPVAGATAAEFSQRRYGGPTRSQMTDVTFGTTTSQIVPSNPRRVHWTLVNLGVASSFIDNRGPAAANAGVPLGAGGGFASMDVLEDGEAVTYPWQGISGGVANAGTLIEIMRV